MGVAHQLLEEIEAYASQIEQGRIPTEEGTRKFAVLAVAAARAAVELTDHPLIERHKPMSVPIITLPGETYLCGGCRQAMTPDMYDISQANSDPTNDTVYYRCATMKCQYRGQKIRAHITRYSAPSEGVDLSLCDCEVCRPPERKA